MRLSLHAHRLGRDAIRRFPRVAQPGRKRPVAEDAVTARRVLLDWLARDADIAEVLPAGTVKCPFSRRRAREMLLLALENRLDPPSIGTVDDWTWVTIWRRQVSRVANLLVCGRLKLNLRIRRAARGVAGAVRMDSDDQSIAVRGASGRTLTPITHTRGGKVVLYDPKRDQTDVTRGRSSSYGRRTRPRPIGRHRAHRRDGAADPESDLQRRTVA